MHALSPDTPLRTDCKPVDGVLITLHMGVRPFAKAADTHAAAEERSAKCTAACAIC